MTNRSFIFPQFKLFIFTFFIIFSPFSIGHTCYWDSDTLKMEQKRFPKVLDLIMGNFPHRSKNFYLWRIKDRKEKLKNTPNSENILQWKEDLMVALDRVGQTEEAIKLAKSILPLYPQRYELHANLGTFYFHSGVLNPHNYKKGKAHIQKALEINPNAHFGRERIQLELVNYIINKAEQNISKINNNKGHQSNNTSINLPLYKNNSSKRECEKILTQIQHQWTQLYKKTLSPTLPWLCPGLKPFGFAHYLLSRKYTLQEGVKGVLGMMYFSNHQSPILLEVLGDLLLADRFVRKKKIWKDAKHLAARSYLAAATFTSEPTSNFYKAKALLALVGIRNLTYMQLEDSFQKERQKSTQYINQLHKKEQNWLQFHPNPEDAFFKTYERWIQSFQNTLKSIKSSD